MYVTYGYYIDDPEHHTCQYISHIALSERLAILGKLAFFHYNVPSELCAIFDNLSCITGKNKLSLTAKVCLLDINVFVKLDTLCY